MHLRSALTIEENRGDIAASEDAIDIFGFLGQALLRVGTSVQRPEAEELCRKNLRCLDKSNAPTASKLSLEHVASITLARALKHEHQYVDSEKVLSALYSYLQDHGLRTLKLEIIIHELALVNLLMGHVEETHGLIDSCLPMRALRDALAYDGKHIAALDTRADIYIYSRDFQAAENVLYDVFDHEEKFLQRSHVQTVDTAERLGQTILAQGWRS